MNWASVELEPWRPGRRGQEMLTNQ
jgi:hypothetical protein